MRTSCAGLLCAPRGHAHTRGGTRKVLGWGEDWCVSSQLPRGCGFGCPPGGPHLPLFRVLGDPSWLQHPSARLWGWSPLWGSVGSALGKSCTCGDRTTAISRCCGRSWSDAWERAAGTEVQPSQRRGSRPGSDTLCSACCKASQSLFPCANGALGQVAPVPPSGGHFLSQRLIFPPTGGARQPLLE